MNVLKALATVIGTAIGFGIAGTGIGAFLGRFTPSLFSILPFRAPGPVDELELGIGLGLINGLIWGMVIGILIVAILSWKEVRLAQTGKDGE